MILEDHGLYRSVVLLGRPFRHSLSTISSNSVPSLSLVTPSCQRSAHHNIGNHRHVHRQAGKQIPLGGLPIHKSARVGISWKEQLRSVQSLARDDQANHSTSPLGLQQSANHSPPVGRASRRSSAPVTVSRSARDGSATASRKLSDSNSKVKTKVVTETVPMIDAVMVRGKNGEHCLELQYTTKNSVASSNESTDDAGERSTNAVRSVRIKPVRSIKTLSTTIMTLDKNAKHRREFERQLREQVGAIHWPAVLSKLEKYTPTVNTDLVSLALRGPLDQLEEFYHTVMGDPTYSVIGDYPIPRMDGGSLLLAGLTKTIQDLIELINLDGEWQALTTVRHGAENDSSASSPAMQPVVRGPRTHTMSQPLNFILSPRAWTKSSFAKHVYSVTTSEPPSVLRQQSIPHPDAVAKVLWELFFGIANVRQVLSYSAIQCAIAYLEKHGKHRTARELVVQMEREGFPPTAEIYNIFLRRCAEEQNMDAFNYNLDLMLANNILPDEGSWIAFITSAPTVEAKQTISLAMFKRGFAIRPAFARINAPQIIPHSFGPFLDSGGLIAEYLDTMDALYGSYWLSSNSVCHLARSLLSRGRVLDAILLVQDLKDIRGLSPLQPILHILLRHCIHDRNADLAIWLYFYAAKNWAIKGHDVNILQIMFEVAWECRMLNLTRLTWKHLCASGAATFIQRGRIDRSLRRRARPETGTAYDSWLSSVGAVACGVDPMSNPSASPRTILDNERRLFGAKPAERGFTLQLMEALLMDKDWAVQQVRKTRGVAWKVQNAISIYWKHRLQLPGPILHAGGRKGWQMRLSNTGALSLANSNRKGAFVVRRIRLSKNYEEGRV